MTILIDLIVVAFIGLSIFLGYKKGLIGVAIKILSFFISIILAFVLCGPVATLIREKTTLDDNIGQSIHQMLKAKEETNGNQTIQVNENMPEFVTTFIEEEINKVATNAQNEIANVVSKNVTNAIINAISFIGIFIVAKILLIILKMFSEQIAELPILKQFNQAGGIAYGVLRGFFVVYLVLGIISLVVPLLQNNLIAETINKTILTNMLYNYNLLLKILF